MKPKKEPLTLDDMLDLLVQQVRQAFDNGLRLRVTDAPPILDYGWSHDRYDNPVFTVHVMQQDS